MPLPEHILYTYRFSHQELVVTTFLCAGCGVRFPVAHLYGRTSAVGSWSLRRRLERGQWHSANPPYRLHVLVCSLACLRLAPVQTLADWRHHFALEDL